MRVQTFIELTEAYSETNSGLDPNDITERNKLFNQHLYSIIVEGGWLELENLEKWANENISEMPLNQVWYGKLGYDFGCVEYFFNEENNAKSFNVVVPKIYTSSPHSNPPGLIYKSDGYDRDILYNAEDPTSIVFN